MKVINKIFLKRKRNTQWIRLAYSIILSVWSRTTTISSVLEYVWYGNSGPYPDLPHQTLGWSKTTLYKTVGDPNACMPTFENIGSGPTGGKLQTLSKNPKVWNPILHWTSWVSHRTIHYDIYIFLCSYYSLQSLAGSSYTQVSKCSLCASLPTHVLRSCCPFCSRGMLSFLPSLDLAHVSSAWTTFASDLILLTLSLKTSVLSSERPF